MVKNVSPQIKYGRYTSSKCTKVIRCFKKRTHYNILVRNLHLKHKSELSIPIPNDVNKGSKGRMNVHEQITQPRSISRTALYHCPLLFISVNGVVWHVCTVYSNIMWDREELQDILLSGVTFSFIRHIQYIVLVVALRLLHLYSFLLKVSKTGAGGGGVKS
jgi:hypothetical protein